MIDYYLSDPRSSYGKTRHVTRQFYDRLLRRIREECGLMILADINKSVIEKLYNDWTEGGTAKKPMAHALVGMVRALVYFGASTLENPECVRLAVTLRTLRYKTSRIRTESLTEDQVRAIIRKAHDRNYHSIALTQALQYECELHQKDCIGEWVPVGEPVAGPAVVVGKEKWVRGLRWSDIDDNFVLRHTTSVSSRSVEIDLKTKPLVLEVLSHFPKEDRAGALVVSEDSKEPWRPENFRRIWREIADACGVSRKVKNRDSRAKARGRPTEPEKKERPAAEFQTTGRVH